MCGFVTPLQGPEADEHRKPEVVPSYRGDPGLSPFLPWGNRRGGTWEGHLPAEPRLPELCQGRGPGGQLLEEAHRGGDARVPQVAHLLQEAGQSGVSPPAPVAHSRCPPPSLPASRPPGSTGSTSPPCGRARSAQLSPFPLSPHTSGSPGTPGGSHGSGDRNRGQEQGHRHPNPVFLQLRKSSREGDLLAPKQVGAASAYAHRAGMARDLGMEGAVLERTPRLVGKGKEACWVGAEDAKDAKDTGTPASP